MSRLDNFLKRSIQTSVVNSHAVTYKHIAPADNPAQLEFNCSGHSDYYTELNSVCLPLRVKLVKTDGSDIEAADTNTVVCVTNLLHSMFSTLSISLNGKPVTLHEMNYHYKTYLEKFLNYGFEASGTHRCSSSWYLDSSEELKDNSGYVKLLNYISSGNTIAIQGRLHADFSNSDKMLINDFDMNIKLPRAPELFYVLIPSDDNKVRIKILDATLLITQVELKHPSSISSH